MIQWRSTVEFGILENQEQIDPENTDKMKIVPVFKDMVKAESMLPLTRSIEGTINMFSLGVMEFVLMRVGEVFFML